LQIDGSAMPNTPISGFTSGDEIDLRAVPLSGEHRRLQFGDWRADRQRGGMIETLTLSGLASGTSFVLTSDGQGGTLIEEAPPRQPIPTPSSMFHPRARPPP